MAGLDLELVRHALTVARRHGYSHVELELGDAHFSASLEPAPTAQAAVAEAPASALALVEDSGGLWTVKAPVVGFARNADSAVKVGETVSSEDVVAVVDALGLANDVEAGASGEIVEVLFGDGDPVQFGQALVKVKVS